MKFTTVVLNQIIIISDTGFEKKSRILLRDNELINLYNVIPYNSKTLFTKKTELALQL